MISEKIFELILRNGMTQKEFSEETSGKDNGAEEEQE